MNTQENYISGTRSLECERPNVKTCCLLKNIKELREAQTRDPTKRRYQL